MQLDNQLLEANNPVVLSPADVSNFSDARWALGGGSGVHTRVFMHKWRACTCIAGCGIVHPGCEGPLLACLRRAAAPLPQVQRCRRLIALGPRCRVLALQHDACTPGKGRARQGQGRGTAGSAVVLFAAPQQQHPAPGPAGGGEAAPQPAGGRAGGTGWAGARLLAPCGGLLCRLCTEVCGAAEARRHAIARALVLAHRCMMPQHHARPLQRPVSSGGVSTAATARSQRPLHCIAWNAFAWPGACARGQQTAIPCSSLQVVYLTASSGLGRGGAAAAGAGAGAGGLPGNASRGGSGAAAIHTFRQLKVFAG